MPRIRVALVDNHESVRDGLQKYFEQIPKFEVLEPVSNGAEALELAARFEPDVFVVDIRMKEMDGFKLTEVLGYRHPAIGVLIASAYNEKEMVHRAMQAGAKGFVSKVDAMDEYIRAIQSIAEGGKYFGKSVASAVFEPSIPERLTLWEIDVLNLSERDRQNKSILDQWDKHIRKCSHYLQPTVLAPPCGLPVALMQLAQDFERRGKFKVTFENSLDDPALPKHFVESLFRITQEALNNIDRHTEATLVTIRLSLEGSCVCMVITDNGRRFSVSELNRFPGIRLRIIGERTKFLRGSFNVTWAPGCTQLMINLLFTTQGDEPCCKLHRRLAFVLLWLTITNRFAAECKNIWKWCPTSRFWSR